MPRRQTKKQRERSDATFAPLFSTRKAAKRSKKLYRKTPLLPPPYEPISCFGPSLANPVSKLLFSPSLFAILVDLCDFYDEKPSSEDTIHYESRKSKEKEQLFDKLSQEWERAHKHALSVLVEQTSCQACKNEGRNWEHGEKAWVLCTELKWYLQAFDPKRIGVKHMRDYTKDLLEEVHETYWTEHFRSCVHMHAEIPDFDDSQEMDGIDEDFDDNRTASSLDSMVLLIDPRRQHRMADVDDKDRDDTSMVVQHLQHEDTVAKEEEVRKILFFLRQITADTPAVDEQ